MKRIASLDGLRAISICIVMLAHVSHSKHFPTHPLLFGRFGVLVFFVISGFLITTLLLREAAATGHIDLRAFYWRRAFRILPSAFAFIAVICTATHIPARFILHCVTFTMCYSGPDRPWNVTHLWSLAVEEQFYLLWPFALSVCFRWRKQISWAVMAIAPVCRILFLHHGWSDIQFYFPTVADALAAGCLLAIYYPQLARRARVLLRPVPVMLMAGLAFYVDAKMSHAGNPYIYACLGGVVPVLLAGIVFSAVERKDWMLNNRVIDKIGVLSYSLYLWQQPFLQAGAAHWWTAFPVNLVFVSSFAYISYRVVEQPMIGLGKTLLCRVTAAIPTSHTGDGVVRQSEPEGELVGSAS